MVTSRPARTRRRPAGTAPLAEWSELRRALRSARDRHVARANERVNRFLRTTTERYSAEIDSFVESNLRAISLRGTLQQAFQETREYLLWLQWVGWNVANLAPVLDLDTPIFAERLALAMLAYSAGRLIDDGIDNHENFKGHRKTLVALMTKHFPKLQASTCRVHSAFLGFCVFQYALRRLRERGHAKSSAAILGLFEEMSSGVLAECWIPAAISEKTYLEIIRRKAACYNMILYSPLIEEIETPVRGRLRRILVSIDMLAQILNDYRDRKDDRKRAHLNAFVRSIYSVEELPALVFARVRKMWETAAPLPAELRDAIATMIDNLGLDSIQGLTEV